MNINNPICAHFFNKTRPCRVSISYYLSTNVRSYLLTCYKFCWSACNKIIFPNKERLIPAYPGSIAPMVGTAEKQPENFFKKIYYYKNNANQHLKTQNR